MATRCLWEVEDLGLIPILFFLEVDVLLSCQHFSDSLLAADIVLEVSFALGALTRH